MTWCLIQYREGSYCAGAVASHSTTYAVADAKQIEHLQPGDSISADLVVSDNKGHLEEITPVAKGSK